MRESSMSLPESIVTETASFVIDAEHPAMPGHFPGAPVVPGVVMLDQVFALMGASGSFQRSLAWAKFARPLLPGQLAEVRWTHSAIGLRFTVSHGGEELMRGLLKTGVAT